MASQIGVSFRINKELKEDFEAFCDSVGLSIPFEVKAPGQNDMRH